MENRNPITRDVRTDSYSEIVPTERVGLGIKGPRGNYERGTLEIVSRDLVVQLSVIQKITETAKQKSHYGGVAQLGEHLPCKQGVMGSNPIISTIWLHSEVGYRAALSRQRSRVRVPLESPLFLGSSVGSSVRLLI